MSLSLAELLRLRLLRTLSALSLVAVFASGCGASASTQAGGAYNAGSPPPPPPPVAKESSAEMSAVAPGAGPSKSSPTAGATADSAVEKKKAEDPNRPGLATHWGENRHSPITSTTFERANSISPMAVGSLWYNDREGARASASAEGYRSTTRAGIEIASGGVTISVRDENGAMLPGYSAGGKTFAIGEAGRRYTLVITNNTPARFEIVASVDGLDVLDGTAASYIKRGYIIRPNSTLEIEGFRRSDQTVAAFRFGDVRGSYAGRKGDDRNVGVIGIAVFHEQGTQPWPWGPSEIEKRRQADPFPGRYAEPPPL